MHGLFLWKIKKALKLPMLFKKIWKKLNRKPNKIWVDKGWEFYNSWVKSWLEKNDGEMYSRHNEGKSVVAETSVVAEKFIRTFKNKIYKYMA